MGLWREIHFFIPGKCSPVSSTTPIARTSLSMWVCRFVTEMCDTTAGSFSSCLSQLVMMEFEILI